MQNSFKHKKSLSSAKKIPRDFCKLILIKKKECYMYIHDGFFFKIQETLEELIAKTRYLNPFTTRGTVKRDFKNYNRK